MIPIKIFLLFFSLICTAFGSFDGDIGAEFNFAEDQYTRVADFLLNQPEFRYIHTGDPTKDVWDTTGFESWTAGFHSGLLWTLYKFTNDPVWMQRAMESQTGLYPRQFDAETHDVGFVIMSSFGLALDLTGNRNYEQVIINAANSLSTRYVESVSAIRSWNNANHPNTTEDDVLVIADNMMNLELLFKAHELTGNELYANIALNHANTTIREHLRNAGTSGSYHVVKFSQASGQVMDKYSHQGYAANSTWSRGQAWLIQGFITTYQWTRREEYLNTAKITADYFLVRIEEDPIPFWDFDVPLDEGYQPRDTSAASIAALGFINIYRETNETKYLDGAVGILNGLRADFKADDVQIPAILINGTVHKDIDYFDTSIIYGDYYYLRALELYRELGLEKDKGNSAGFLKMNLGLIMFLIVILVD